MDDYSLSSLSESKNEWCARLVNTLTPAIVEGLRSIYKEAFELCIQNDEEDKYLMTFQTFLSRIPKWNDTMLNDERKRIETSTACTYLEDLITCVHIIQLKALTCVRVGQKQKKIDIDVPSCDSFIHKIYIIIARKLYTNVYLFEKGVPPLEQQKRNRELELLVMDSILNAIRDTMPIEDILRAYMDETEEQNVEVSEHIVEEVKNEEVKNEETKNEEVKNEESPNNDVTENVIKIDTPSVIVKSEPIVPSPSDIIASETSETSETPINKLSFNDLDQSIDINGVKGEIDAPKNLERLETIAENTAEKRRAEAEAEEEDDEEKITIGDDVKLELTDINNLTNPSIKVNDPILDDIEILG